MEDNYSNAQGYGIFCGKKCVARKKAEGIAPKRGKKNIATWNAEQAAIARAQEGAGSQSSSKAPLVIGVVLVLGIIATIVIVKMRK